MNKTIITIFAITAVLSLFLIACTGPGTNPYKPPSFPNDNSDLEGEELMKFESSAELLAYLEDKNSPTSSYRSFGGMDDMMVMEESVAMVADAAPALPSTGGAKTATDVSQTNNQVEGVDEADIVKNDNKYIYTLTQDKLVIVDAFPAEDMNIMSETEIDGNPVNLFVNGNRLVVLTNDYEEVYTIQKFDFMPRSRRIAATHAYVYDITDRANPELVKDYNTNGGYFQARMIGDYVYFISKDNVYYYTDYVAMPVVREASTRIAQPDVYYFDNPEDSYSFHTIASFNIQADENTLNAKSFMLGYSNTLYVSQDNIYITYQKNSYRRNYDEEREEQFFEVIVPLLPSAVENKINSIWDSGSSTAEKWDLVAEELEVMYNTMDEDDKEDLLDDIEDDVRDYQAQKEAERRKSVIHKIEIDKGSLDWKARGEVSGYLNDQFSLDEYKGNLRVATTTYIYRGGSTMYNNVFVLDEDLDMIGSIEDIAEDERIYSTRFLGDRLYMVTFKRIDPLFVIDLSNPRSPAILGELKIPGFSEYLHPYDEDHIIGIGKETESNNWGGVSTGGVKVALFDVSDVTNPIEVDNIEIGSSGTDSEALRDHKAVLFDRERDTLVIPVREIKSARFYDDVNKYYSRKIWQGAYVLKITPEKGIEQQGKISHSESDEQDRYYWRSPTTVRRALYMDDVLYTISASVVKANDFDTLEDVNKVELPYKDTRYYPQPYW